MVHGHLKSGKAVALLGSLFYPVQVAVFFFVGLGVSNEVLAIGIMLKGLACLQGVLTMRQFVFAIKVGQVAVACEFAQFNGLVKVRFCLSGV